MKKIIEEIINNKQLMISFYEDFLSRHSKQPVSNLSCIIEDEKKQISSLIAIFQTAELPSAKGLNSITEKLNKINTYLNQPSEMIGFIEKAMMLEKTFFQIFLILSETCQNKITASLFRTLSMEESNHKMIFEISMDEYHKRQD